MKRIKISILLLIVAFALIISCKKNKNNYYYKNLLQKYPDIFINHFPKSIDRGQIDITENGEYDVTRLFLIEKEYNNNIIEKLKQKSLAIYSANDTCLFIINKFTTKKNYTQEKKARSYTEIHKYIKSQCIEDKLPVPNFWGLFNNVKTICNLPKEYKVYILEAKKGKYWDKKHRSNGEYMPSYWKHGYSKGVAINDKTHEIIYWFVLW